MESKNRGVWIFLVVVLVGACCFALAVAGGAAGWFLFVSDGRSVQMGGGEARSAGTYQVGSAPLIEIENFAGRVIVRAGDGDGVEVVATKKAPLTSNLERIEVDVIERDGSLMIETGKPATYRNVSVDLEITVPAGSFLRAQTGAGSVEVYDLTGDIELDSGAGSLTIVGVSGEIEAHTGAGSIDVQGAVSRVRLDTGAGSIDYQGTPVGDCEFESGAGSITLRLPAGLNASVDLETGVGTVSSDFAIDGSVSKREVRGTIGGGDGARIYAQTGTGSIQFVRR